MLRGDDDRNQGAPGCSGCKHGATFQPCAGWRPLLNLLRVGGNGLLARPVRFRLRPDRRSISLTQLFDAPCDARIRLRPELLTDQPRINRRERTRGLTNVLRYAGTAYVEGTI